MIQSMRHWAEGRAPALCNELSISRSGCRREKVNSQAYLGALKKLAPIDEDPKCQYQYGRHAVPRQSAVRAARKAGNMVGGGFRVSPASQERSWPRPAQTLRSSPELAAAVQALPKSDYLAGSGLFDMDAIRTHVSDHSSERHDHSVLLSFSSP